jgi:phosphoribosylaminoimidazole carboxylase (NCAIR synthetase)
LDQLNRYGQGARALLGPNDALLDASARVTLGWTGRAWCPTPQALARLAQAGAKPEPHPPLSVLRAVNHRKFAVDLALGLPDQYYVEDRAMLDARLRDNHRQWLLKRPLSFAGRGQQRILGQVDARQSAWIDASLRRSGLVIEPLVQPTFEVSLHGFIWRDGHCELGRVCVQQISERGVFRGIRLALDGELSSKETRLLFQATEQAAVALTRAGYFGPFGIDGYRYNSVNGEAFCALGEINARYSMGFATGFPRHPSELSLT